MDIFEAITARKSIRSYRPDAIPEDVLLDVLNAARLAPSWANTQATRYVVVKDPAIKEKLADATGPTNPCRKGIVEAPAVICLVSQRGVSGIKKGQAVTDKGDWFMFDAGLAAEHLALAACAKGLGTCHVGAFDAAKAEGALDIPEGFSIVEMIPLGYFDKAPDGPPRKPLKDLVFADRFGKSYLE